MDILHMQRNHAHRFLSFFFTHCLLTLVACVLLVISATAQTIPGLGTVLFWEKGLPPTDSTPLIPLQAPRKSDKKIFWLPE